MELNTTLLRERFTLREQGSDKNEESLVATSNRIPLVLRDSGGNAVESFIIRTQTMHSAIRMAGLLQQTFARIGPIMARAEAFDFAEAWDRANSDHDTAFNPHRWVAVYCKGKAIFESGERTSFLDVIEKCDSVNPGNYDRAVGIAEETFRKMGRTMSITHESNIGMVFNVRPDVGRCGLILRNPHKSTTFNFTIEPKEDQVSPLLCLNACAAFLEGIQLSVRIGMINEKLRAGAIGKFSPEAKEGQSALKRLAQLDITIDDMNSRFNVRYRPEKPEFPLIVREAEVFQRNLSGLAKA